MHILFFIITILICILFYILLKSFGLNTLMVALCSFLIIIILTNPSLFINSALNGAKLFFLKVFPSILPFLIISNLLIAFGGIKIYSKLLGKFISKPLLLKNECSIVLIISMICGYPLGAKYSCDLYEMGTIDYNTCSRLLNIASNPSPLFIVGTVGTAMLKNTSIGYILLVSSYISCFIMGYVTLIHAKSQTGKISKVSHTNKKEIKKNMGQILKESIDNSISTCLSIFGYIVIFSVLIDVIKNTCYFNYYINTISSITSLPKEFISGLSLGIIEMTNGCSIVSGESIKMFYKVISISFLLCFSGFSVISQAYSFMYKSGFSLKKYTFLKFIQGIINCIITAILCTLLHIS